MHKVQHDRMQLHIHAEVLFIDVGKSKKESIGRETL